MAPPRVPGAALHRHRRRRRTARSTPTRRGPASAAIASTRTRRAPTSRRSRDEWVNANIRSKGPLGKLYPYPCCIHEGDTPSFLGLIDNGLASAMSPAYGGWGGRYVWRQPYGETRPFWTQGGDSYPGRDNSRDTVDGRRRPDPHLGSGDDLALADARSSTTSPRAWTGRSRTRERRQPQSRRRRERRARARRRSRSTPRSASR